MLGLYFFTAIWLQEILGFSPTKAGLLFVPMAIMLAAFAGASTREVTGITRLRRAWRAQRIFS
jgi:hypothetical protein